MLRKRARRLAWKRTLCVIAILACLALAAVASAAMAQGGSSEGGAEASPLTPKLIEEANAAPAVEMTQSKIDTEAAAELPHAELDGNEALSLLTAVFGPAVETPAGIFDEVPPGRFIGTNAEVMSAESLAALAEVEGSEESKPEMPTGPGLVESTLPLRVETEGGAVAPVDLGLEPAEGELQEENPIVAAGIPSELGEGVELAEGEIGISFPGAPAETAPTIIEGNSAFYPNVQEDTDLVVAPMPTGVETLTQIRTPEAPSSQVEKLSLPTGAVLVASENGGAEVTQNGSTLMEVTPPTAVDAAGNPVSTNLTVSGDELLIAVSPVPGAAYPILVDPNFRMDEYNWTWGGSKFNGWVTSKTAAGYQAYEYGYPNQSIPALDLMSGSVAGGGTPNTGAQWYYQVPRWNTDQTTYGDRPHSWIEYVSLSGQMFIQESNHAYFPEAVAGIINPFPPGSQWVAAPWTYNGTQPEFVGWSGYTSYSDYGNPNGKLFSFGLITLENEYQAPYRNTLAAEAVVELRDEDTPQITSLSGPGGWMNSGEANLTYSATDPGLGVTSFEVGVTGQPGPVYSLGCSGTTALPCPRVASTGAAGSPALAVNAATAPQGVDSYSVTVRDPLYGWESGGTDPVSHQSTRAITLKVDHSAPTVALSGSLTEQAYKLAVEANDGLSGVREAKVYLDGQLKETKSGSCTAGGCGGTLGWTYSQPLAGLSVGQHTLEVVATDQVGLSKAATQTFTIEVPDTVIDSGPEGLTSQNTPKFTYHSTQSGSTFQCRVDGGAFAGCPATGDTTAQLTEGQHTFEVKAISGAGLEDPTPAKREFRTMYAPDTTITFGPEGLTNLTQPVYAYESNNRDATFECKLDSGSFKPCNLVETEAPEDGESELSEGSHAFSVRAVNQLGDVDPTPATASITVDAEPPTAQITSGPTGPTKEARPTFNFTASGGTASCLFETEAQANSEEEISYGTCTTSTSYTPPAALSEGNYQFYVLVEDEAENQIEEARDISVDLTAPDTTIVSAPASTTDDSTPALKFSSSDPGASFQCRYGTEAFRACSGPGATDTPATALAEGTHTFEVRAVDAAGNVDATPAKASFTVMTKGPQTSINSGPEGAVAATEATFTYSADESATFECKLDSGSFASCPVGGKTYTGLAEGEHVFEVRGKNGGGFADPTPARRAFIVDTSAPSALVLSGPIFEAEGYGPSFRVEATDGSNSSSSSKRSGVQTVQIILGGSVVKEMSAECEANVCPPTFVRAAQIPYEALLAAPAGASVEAKAIDGKGHMTTATKEIKEPHENVVEPSGSTEGGTFGPLAQAAASEGNCKPPLKPLLAADYKGSRAVGTPHDDLIVWKKGIKLMEGNGGCDVIIGGPGPQTINGGPGDDIIRGGGSDDHLNGGADADRIFGGIGDDTMKGGSENDILDGGPGADVERGETGEDTLSGGQGGDKLFGGKQIDTVSYADALAPGFVEEEKGEEEEAKGRAAFRVQAEEKNVPKDKGPDFPLPSQSGVYIKLDAGKVFGGKLGQGGGTDEIKGDEHIVGSPFADWIEGTGEATEIEPGPGDDAIFNTTAKVNSAEGDWINGNRVGEDKTNYGNLQIGEYEAGGETNVYVIGSPENDGLTVKPVGSEVRITANDATKGRLPTAPLNCAPLPEGGNTIKCPDKKQLGALLIYGGKGNDNITMQEENKNLPGSIELDGGPEVDQLHGGAEEELLVDGIQHGSSNSKEGLQGNGGEDALSQGEGADVVEGGAGNDLFLNSRICENDAYYADTAKVRPPPGAADNAQFHPLPDLAVYANFSRKTKTNTGGESLGGIGHIKKVEYKENCGSGAGRSPLVGFNDFEGSPEGDTVIGNENHNFIIGRGGENRLKGGLGNDLIDAKNGHPEWVINCGGQKEDRAQVDGEDNAYIPQWKKSCPAPPGNRGKKRYDDGQPKGLWKSKTRKKAAAGGGKAAALLEANSLQVAALTAEEEEGVETEEGFGEEEEGLFPTAEFHLDETSGTSAANEIDEEAPAGTYMAKGTGPHVNGPGPVLGGESALVGGGEEGEPEEGSSISLNGENAYVDLAGQAGPLAGESGYSVSLDVKFARAPGQREYLFSSGEGGSGAYLYRATNGSIVFATGQGPGAASVASDPVGAGAWHQAVASFEGSTIQLNVDGFGYELDYGSPVSPRAASAPESLLGAGPGVTNLLAGSLDEVIAYEGAMSEGDILMMLGSSKAQIAEYLPRTAPETADADGDSVPDGADNCPTTANPDQADANEDGIGDACQVLDEDGDGIANSADNCPSIYNPEQTDTNGDRIGDACSVMPPEVETGEATAVKANSVTIGGSVDPEGSATTYQFEYGTNTAYGNRAPVTATSAGSGAAPVPVSVALGSLTVATTYHYRLVATNAWGTEAGEDRTFTTLTLPAATTSAATAVTNTSATLHGTVDPEGLETTYQFEYGTSLKYGTKAPAAAQSAGSGSSPVAVSTPLSGLVAGTTYYYRIAATSAGGTAYSGSSTFTTTGGTISGTQLAAMAVTEPFDGSSTSLSNFGSKWAALGWAGGTAPKGTDTTTGWDPYDGFSTVNGAYYNSSLSDSGAGLAAVATLGTSPGITERYFSLWLDMSNPTATTRSGYELRFTDIGTNTYKVTLSRWSAGVQTVLATEGSYAFPVASSFALTDQGSTVTAWTNTGSGFVKLIGATNSEFSGGRAGIEGSGNITRLKNFKFGVPSESGGGGSAMNTALQNLTLMDAFSTTENPLSEGGNWAALQWDTSTSGHNTGQVSGGWGPYDAFSTVNGAYWHESFIDSGTGDAATATLSNAPGLTERYFSLWLNASSPGTIKSGYELRFYESAAGTYTVTIARWSSGTKTVLATQTGFTFSVGGKFALVEKAKTVSAWTAPVGGEFTQLLSATDTTFASGRPAVEASGNGTRMTNLRAGVLPAF